MITNRNITLYAAQYSGKAYMSYGGEDSVMTGDRVTSGKLRSPTTVYVGDGSSGGFNYVVVSIWIYLGYVYSTNLKASVPLFLRSHGLLSLNAFQNNIWICFCIPCSLCVCLLRDINRETFMLKSEKKIMLILGKIICDNWVHVPKYVNCLVKKWLSSINIPYAPLIWYYIERILDLQ